MGIRKADANRKIRQEALRDQLAAGAHIQHYITTIQKIESLDPHEDTFNNQLNQLKVANDQRIKLIDKYLPSVKPVELSGDEDSPLTVVTKIVLESLENDGS